MPSKLGYWDLRGLGGSLRVLLTYVGEEFEDIRYKIGPAPEFKLDEWFNVKFTLGLAFPNIPYYMDDGVKITQSTTIHRYLGRKYKLDGETPQEKADCDAALESVMDMRNLYFKYCYGPADVFKDTRAEFVKGAKGRISIYNDFLGDKQFLIGTKVTVCDFFLNEMLTHHQLLEPTIMDDFPKLKNYMQRFEALPGIKAFRDADKGTIINGPMANFH